MGRPDQILAELLPVLHGRAQQALTDGDPARTWSGVLAAHWREVFARRAQGDPLWGALCPEELGAVHEALLELEPGLTARPSTRLRRHGLEVVVSEEEAAAQLVGSIVEVERLPAGRFFTRRGIGRKQSGSFYTPRPIVRHLVAEALAPQLARARRAEDVLSIRVLDPAAGIGLFLLEAAHRLAEAIARIEGGDARTYLPEVASRCLYAADRDAIALQIAASLIEEACGAPLPEGRFVVGDSVASPLHAARSKSEQEREEASLPRSAREEIGSSEGFFALFPEASEGFHAVVGNPPWEAIQPYAREFFAAWDLRVLEAPTRKEREAIERALLERPAIREAWQRHRRASKRLRERLASLYPDVQRGPGGRPGQGNADLWQPFAARSLELLRPGGRAGLLLPSAFHANQSATGIRSLFLDRARLVSCYSFENRERLFPIHRSFKFAAVVVERGAPSEAFDCAFYLRDPSWLQARQGALRYDRAFVDATGGPQRAFLELRGPADLAVAKTLHRGGLTFGQLARDGGVVFGSEAHMTRASSSFSKEGMPLVEGKCFHQWNDRWEAPRYRISTERQDWIEAARHPRVAYRAIASSTNERTSIFALLPPGVICGNSATVERLPGDRRIEDALVVAAIGNSFPFDWLVRQRGGANVNAFLLDSCPVPRLDEETKAGLVDAALRLSCSHDAFLPLWRSLRGGKPPRLGEEERSELRAGIDASIARAYGLQRDAYAHLLGSFRDRELASRCLFRFDELAEKAARAG